MTMSKTLTELADSFRSVSGLTDKFKVADISEGIRGLAKVNLVQNPDDQWHTMNAWNTALTTIPVDTGKTYSASIEVKNVSGGRAVLMAIMQDEKSNFLDPNTGEITSQVGSSLKVLDGDVWSDKDFLHSGTFTITKPNCRYLQIRIAGNAFISVDYRKLMINAGAIPFPYTSQHIMGGVNSLLYLLLLSSRTEVIAWE